MAQKNCCYCLKIFLQECHPVKKNSETKILFKTVLHRFEANKLNKWLNVHNKRSTKIQQRKGLQPDTAACLLQLGNERSKVRIA